MSSAANDLVISIFKASAALHERFAAEQGQQMLSAAAAVSKALKQGRQVLAFGNGGSATDAQHLIAELVGRFEGERRSLPGVALTADSAIVTAIANTWS